MFEAEGCEYGESDIMRLLIIFETHCPLCRCGFRLDSELGRTENKTLKSVNLLCSYFETVLLASQI